MIEEWRNIVGWEKIYQVSNLGVVRRLPISYKGMTSSGPCIKKKEGFYYPKVYKNKKGYLVVGLCFPDKGKADTKLIHRLVAEAFNPCFEKKLQIDHIDMNKENNRSDNLDCVTLLENLQRSHRYGSHSLKRGKPSLKIRVLSLSQVSLIKEMYSCEANKINYTKNGKPFEQRWLAKCFNCSQNTIMKIVNNKSCYD